jgi:hypothetical protein
MAGEMGSGTCGHASVTSTWIRSCTLPSPWAHITGKTLLLAITFTALYLQTGPGQGEESQLANQIVSFL